MTSLLDCIAISNAEPPEGERHRDAAFATLDVYRAALVRRLQRSFVQHLLDHGPDTSDAIRNAVPIPPGVDARVVGGAVGLLSTRHKLIKSVGATKTRRKAAHARRLEVWSLRDEEAARLWLLTHPELVAEPASDSDDPFAV
jgi:hypothetical protein